MTNVGMDGFTPLEKSAIIDVKIKLRSIVMDNLKLVQFPYVTDKMFVAGGAIASLLQRTHPKDIDIYFEDQGIASVVQRHYTKENDYVKELNEKYRDDNGFTGEDGKCITENAITLINGIQFITKHTGSPQDIRKTFDFVHCLPYYHIKQDTLYISKQQYDACTKKQLIINNGKSVTKHRIEKFKDRGYR